MNCHCDNCVWSGPESELQSHYPDIPGLSERMEPGGEVPVGECPKCGALAYQTDETAAPPLEVQSSEFKVQGSPATQLRAWLQERNLGIFTGGDDEARELAASIHPQLPAHQLALAQLGSLVLDILEAHEDWSSDTTDEISTAAFNLGLADNGGPDAHFRRLPAPPSAESAPSADASSDTHLTMLRAIESQAFRYQDDAEKDGDYTLPKAIYQDLQDHLAKAATPNQTQ